MSPSALGLGLYSAAAAAVTSASSVSTSAAVGLAGLNAAASELARLGDRAAACVGPSPPGLAPWSLPAPFAAVESPSERLCRLDRTAADDRKRNLDDYVNNHRCVKQLPQPKTRSHRRNRTELAVLSSEHAVQLQRCEWALISNSFNTEYSILFI